MCHKLFNELPRWPISKNLYIPCIASCNKAVKIIKRLKMKAFYYSWPGSKTVRIPFSILCFFLYTWIMLLLNTENHWSFVINISSTCIISCSYWFRLLGLRLNAVLKNSSIYSYGDQRVIIRTSSNVLYLCWVTLKLHCKLKRITGENQQRFIWNYC